MLKIWRRPKKEEAKNEKENTSSENKKTWLKITNKGTVDREFLELIGATTKREQYNDSSIIGNKGSGAKFSVIPVLRLGLELIVSSSDQQGPYTLRYRTEPARIGGQRVIFDYGTEVHPSQFTLDALQDWDKPIGNDNKQIFKALREFICNAYDADKGFTVETVSEVTPAEKGKTVVYLSMTAEIEEILKHPQRYFKFLSNEKPLFATTHGAIYPKSDVVTRLFLQGVLVDCKSYYKSLFDYSVVDKWLLSEERIIKDFSRFMETIGRIIAEIDNLEIALKMLDGFTSEEAEIEEQAIYKIQYVSTKTREIFKKAWEMTYGSKAAIAVWDTQANEDARQVMGYNIVSINGMAIQRFLRSCGISMASDLVPKRERKEEEKKEYEIVELTPQQKAIFDEAYSIFTKFFPQTKRYPVKFYKPLTPYFDRASGFAKIGYGEVWINAEKIIDVQTCLGDLEHETRHVLTQAGDYDRAFDHEATNRLVAFMINYAGSPKPDGIYKTEIVNQGIVLPRRLVGKEVHILIENDELRIKVHGENALFQTRLAKPVEGHLSQRRKVGKFSGRGCVFIPTSIRKQLPSKLQLEVIR
jgi:hypothetical protein